MDTIKCLIPATHTWSKYKNDDGTFFYMQIIGYAVLFDSKNKIEYMTPMELCTKDGTIEELNASDDNFVEIIFFPGFPV